MPKIIIVDDEKHIRLLLARALKSLEDQGVELLMAENGLRALEMIQAHKPELALLDIMLPKMNGFDLCRKVKKELGLPTYVLMVSAKGQEQDKAKGMDCGADGYLIKPFNPIAILEKAKEILGL